MDLYPAKTLAVAFPLEHITFLENGLVGKVLAPCKGFDPDSTFPSAFVPHLDKRELLISFSNFSPSSAQSSMFQLIPIYRSDGNCTLPAIPREAQKGLRDCLPNEYFVSCFSEADKISPGGPLLSFRALCASVTVSATERKPWSLI